jgi:hypothetical protein
MRTGWRPKRTSTALKTCNQASVLRAPNKKASLASVHGGQGERAFVNAVAWAGEGRFEATAVAKEPGGRVGLLFRSRIIGTRPESGFGSESPVDVRQRDGLPAPELGVPVGGLLL